MKKLYILISVLLVGCSDPEVHKCDQINKQPKIEYIEKYCPRCNGVGVVEYSTSEKVLWGLVTCGVGFLFDTTKCSICHGTGVIKVKKLNNE